MAGAASPCRLHTTVTVFFACSIQLVLQQPRRVRFPHEPVPHRLPHDPRMALIQ